MFNPANQTHFSLQIDGLDHDLQVLEFSGREALDQPYRFEVELVSEKPDLDLAELLGKPAFLAFAPDGSGIHGLEMRIMAIRTTPRASLAKDDSGKIPRVVGSREMRQTANCQRVRKDHAYCFPSEGSQKC